MFYQIQGNFAQYFKSITFSYITRDHAFFPHLLDKKNWSTPPNIIYFSLQPYRSSKFVSPNLYFFFPFFLFFFFIIIIYFLFVYFSFISTFDFLWNFNCFKMAAFVENIPFQYTIWQAQILMPMVFNLLNMPFNFNKNTK